MQIISHSSLETESIAQQIAKKLKKNEIIALYGDLGTGKTTFTRGLADYFDMKNITSSPTFSIINEYQNDKITIYHFDMYRVRSFEDLESTGFFDYLDKGVMIIEWSENIKQFLPKNIIEIKIEKLKQENERLITIEGANI